MEEWKQHILGTIRQCIEIKAIKEEDILFLEMELCSKFSTPEDFAFINDIIQLLLHQFDNGMFKPNQEVKKILTATYEKPKLPEQKQVVKQKRIVPQKQVVKQKKNLSPRTTKQKIQKKNKPVSTDCKSNRSLIHTKNRKRGFEKSKVVGKTINLAASAVGITEIALTLHLESIGFIVGKSDRFTEEMWQKTSSFLELCSKEKRKGTKRKVKKETTPRKIGSDWFGKSYGTPGNYFKLINIRSR